jgi:hypothetical protein
MGDERALRQRTVYAHTHTHTHRERERESAIQTTPQQIQCRSHPSSPTEEQTARRVRWLKAPTTMMMRFDWMPRRTPSVRPLTRHGLGPHRRQTPVWSHSQPHTTMATLSSGLGAVRGAEGTMKRMKCVPSMAAPRCEVVAALRGADRPSTPSLSQRERGSMHSYARHAYGPMSSACSVYTPPPANLPQRLPLSKTPPSRV